MPVIVGIFNGEDAVKSLVGALKAAALSVERLQVVSGDDPSEGLAQSGVRFVYSGEAQEVSTGPGVGEITGLGGTGVPGLTDLTPRVAAFRDRSLVDNLGDLEIPESRLDDYAEAVEAGRIVAGYPTRDAADADNIKRIFSQAGASPV